MVRVGSIAVAALLSIAAGATSVAAQVRPPETQPGQVERQFQRPPEPQSAPAPISIPEPVLQPPENATSVTFVLKQLVIEGATIYRPESLQRTYAQLLNREVSLAEIYQLAARLTARYRNDGYILSQVFVPAQTVQGGTIRLRAVEGYVANVQIVGGGSLGARAAEYGDKVRASRPLKMAALERYVLLLNDLPGVTAHVVLTPSLVPGAADLIVQVATRRTFAEGTSDNRGGRAQGPGRALGDVDLHSMVAGPSRTELRGVTTFNSELTYVQAAHDQFFGLQGGKLTVTGSYSYSKPKELSIVPLDLTTSSVTSSVSYGYPVIRRRSRNLSVRALFSTFDSTTKVFGVNDTIDHVRSVALGATYDNADPLGGVSVVDVAVTQGLSGLGASRDGDQLLSRATGRPDFRKVTFYGQRVQSLPHQLSLVLGVNAQYALTDLLSSEMFSFGGELFGRGYDPSALLDDHGAATKLDLQYARKWSNKVTIAPYLFGDVGEVWQRTPVPGVSSSQKAASAGGGIRLLVAAQLSGYIEVAKPLNSIVGQDPSRTARVFAGMTVR